jgi:hypothetical protein
MYSFVTMLHRWLRRNDTSRKDVDSCSPVECIHLHNPSTRNMPLRFTQPLAEMSTGMYFWG